MTSIGLVLDCADAERLVDFWTAALGYRRLGAAGVDIALGPPEGDERPTLILQNVTEPRRGKNRMHMDLHVTDIEAEAARLERIGATRDPDGRLAEHGAEWIRMADPEGNEFCVCRS